MTKHIQLLDCTLRDGAYIVNSEFGEPTIKGIIKKLQDANVDIIECGWLKNNVHKTGTTFYHIPSDLEHYITEKKSSATYTVMIDWDRYDTSNLPENDRKSIDAIRVVFPYGKHKEAIEVGQKIREKNYRVFFQAANTLAYSDEDLKKLSDAMNDFLPESLSVVDTFGAMYIKDVERIACILDEVLDKKIKLGFHSHNNQQLSFALTMRFVELLEKSERSIVVDSSLCGMGRGAGNATTELMASYLNRQHYANYDMNVILDAIDTYMISFQVKFSWGYSTPYFIAGLYCTHVNNIAYLLENHHTSARDMRNIIESLSPEDRIKYDYDLLEKRYIENQSRIVDDEVVIENLKKQCAGKKIILIAPGKKSVLEEKKIKTFIKENEAIVIGVNAVLPRYDYDYLFFVNAGRYDYAQTVHQQKFSSTKKILLSNIKTVPDGEEIIINYNRVIKRGWEHFDNAVITALRLCDILCINSVAMVGFDGFSNVYNESYADSALPSLNPGNKWAELNEEIKDMFADFKKSANYCKNIEFVTESYFNE